LDCNGVIYKTKCPREIDLSTVTSISPERNTMTAEQKGGK
jgi:hypothetical protein